jgi:16S rRNA processing protein RimM
MAKIAIIRHARGDRDSRKGDELHVTVGRIGRPHGIRGDVVVGVRTDEPELRFAKGSRLDTDPADLGPLTVAGIKWHSGELLVRFEGIGDRDAAGELRGTWLTVDSATIAPPQDPDEFRDADLVGLSVRTVDGTQVGTVDDVLHSGQDVLVIKSADGRETMVPFVKPLVPDVDIPGGMLTINPPDGLLNPEEA